MAGKKKMKTRSSAARTKTKARRKSVVKTNQKGRRAKSGATLRKKILQERFLELFPQLWTKTSTAKAIRRDVTTIDEWLREDPEFRRRFEEEAIPAAVADTLESDAIRKVIRGRPAGFYQGQPVMAPVYKAKTGMPKW